MIKVALIRNVSSNNLYGGIRKHCDELYKLFNKKGSLVSIATVENIPGGCLMFINKKYFFLKSLYQYIKKSEADVIHLHGFMSLDVIQTIIVAKLLKKKIVYSPHYHPFEFLRNPFLGRMYFYLFLRHFLPMISAIVTISNIDTSFFERYHKKVIRIPHQFNKESSLLNCHQKKNKDMILFVGRNESNKGLDHLYELPMNRYEVHCVTKGKVLRDDFILHSNISDEELFQLYEKASLVVIPSRYEAFSYVALEAFSHGTPVLMSDRVRVADYLSGCNGYKIFRYANYNEFINSVETTIGIEVDVEKILSQFDEDLIMKMYEKIYFSVV